MNRRWSWALVPFVVLLLLLAWRGTPPAEVAPAESVAPTATDIALHKGPAADPPPTDIAVVDSTQTQAEALEGVLARIEDPEEREDLRRWLAPSDADYATWREGVLERSRQPIIAPRSLAGCAALRSKPRRCC